MTDVGKPERVTQDRVVALLRDELGYAYLGDWSERAGNGNVDEELVGANLARRGYTPAPALRARLNRLPVREESWKY